MAKGDLSTFLRDWLGCLIPIGYQKDIGFEYQYTSERGFEGRELLQNSTTHFATYAGEGIKGDNPNYYKMVPPVFSLTLRQKEAISETTTMGMEDLSEEMFNIVRYNAKGMLRTASPFRPITTNIWLHLKQETWMRMLLPISRHIR